jgi:hypothetical protein
MSYIPEKKGFFAVVSGTSNWNDNILNYERYLETSGDTIKLKDNYSFNMNAEGHLAVYQIGSLGRISMYRLSSTTDKDYMGQIGGYSGSAITHSDDRMIDTSSSSFTLSIYTSGGSGTIAYIPSACCTIILFYGA